MKRILLVRTDRVGDVVFITPMIREIRKAFPDAFIATLTQPHTKNLLINNPNLNETLTDDLDKKSFWKVVRELRRHKFTHGLLMMPTERVLRRPQKSTHRILLLYLLWRKAFQRCAFYEATLLLEVS